MNARERYERQLRAAFQGSHEREPEVLASAPGRVNLLGEHTDYNGGFVLPTALRRRTYVALARRIDAEVTAFSESIGQSASFRIGEESTRGTWIDYVQGVTRAAREHGYALSGFDARISTQLALGSGLSSSASLEVALLRAMSALFEWSIDDVTLAKLAQWGENNVVGAPVGILDPMACQLADEQTALFIDTRSLEHRRLPLPPQAELLVVDSGVRHAHASGHYRQRREECETAARLLGLPQLRDLDPNQLGRVVELPDPLGKRAWHVITENQRVLAAVKALESADADDLGELFTASHASMRDDFEVSVPEVDRIVHAAARHSDVFGARMTGGGFGGAIVCLVRKGTGGAVGRALEALGAHVVAAESDGTP